MRELIHGFGRWWLKEFLDLLPRRIADWLVDDGARTLVLAPEVDAVTLHLKTDRGRFLASRRVDRADFAADRIDAFLRAHGQRRDQVALGVSLPKDLVFARSFALPLETRHTLDAVVVQDLLAKTPFQLDDIHHGHRARREGNRLIVSQWVVRRTHVVAAAETLGLEPDAIGFVEASDGEALEAPPQIATKRSLSRYGSRWPARITFGLAAMALVLAITVPAARYYRQQEILDGLQSEIAAATAKAKSVLSVMDEIRQEQSVIRRLRAKRDEPSLLDLWEEATRVLPQHTWLSELRLSETPDGRQVVMSGFSAAAASLVGLLDRSQVFTEAGLVGPIAVDPTEGKERFIIQAKLKASAASKTASQ